MLVQSSPHVSTLHIAGGETKHILVNIYTMDRGQMADTELCIITRFDCIHNYTSLAPANQQTKTCREERYMKCAQLNFHHAKHFY